MANHNKSVSHSDGETLIFTYGTLKRGFHNHTLMQDLIAHNDASYLGDHITLRPHPLVCGPHGIPYLIDLPGSGHRVRGELYSVSPRGLARVDDLEGIDIGHYERLQIRVLPLRDGLVSSSEEKEEDDEGTKEGVLSAEAYFAHRSFGEAMWRRNLMEGLREFSDAEGLKYVKRRDRPREGKGILEDIQAFVANSREG